MKSGRLQAFSFCPSCKNIRAVRSAVITYTSETTRIKGNCITCGTSVDIIGRRHHGVRIGSDKRHLN